MINIPIAIIAVAMASIGLIDSPRVAIAIMIPIMGVNESAIIVFIVPILLSPSSKSENGQYRDYYPFRCLNIEQSVGQSSNRGAAQHK